MMRNITRDQISEEYKWQEENHDGSVPSFIGIMEMCIRYAKSTAVCIGGASLAMPIIYEKLVDITVGIVRDYDIPDEVFDGFCTYLEKYLFSHHGNFLPDIGFAFTLLAIPFLEATLQVYSLVRKYPGHPKQWYLEEMAKTDTVSDDEKTALTNHPDKWDDSRSRAYEIAWSANVDLGLLSDTNVATPIDLSPDIFVAMNKNWSISPDDINKARNEARKKPKFKKVE